LGATASVKKVSQKGEAPAISAIGRVSIPGWCMSTSMKEMPSCFLALKSVRVSRPHQSEYCAPLVHVFWPLMVQWSPASMALVCSEAKSDPALGSE